MKKNILIPLSIFFLLGTFVSCTKSKDDSGGGSPAALQGTWTAKAARPTSSQNFAAVTILDSLILTMGGQGASGDNTSMELYDPSSDTWVTGSVMPAGTQGFGAALINFKVYVFGGTVPIYSCFDLLQSKWTNITASPNYHLSFGQPAIVNGKIYMFGGLKESLTASSNMVEMYDPATDSYDLMATMPSSRHNPAIAVMNNKVYVIGGASRTNTTDVTKNTLEVYDPGSDAWAVKVGMPTSRQGACAEVIDGKIYVIGGMADGNIVLNTVEMYDPAINTWTTFKPMPTGRSSFVLGKVRNKLYAIGGGVGTSRASSNITEEFVP
jgi:N-acetylneuraminic acid mutarotase